MSQIIVTLNDLNAFIRMNENLSINQ